MKRIKSNPQPQDDIGIVSVGGFRFTPAITVRRNRAGLRVYEPIPGVYALPGGGIARLEELPEIARLMREWMGGW